MIGLVNGNVCYVMIRERRGYVVVVVVMSVSTCQEPQGPQSEDGDPHLHTLQQVRQSLGEGEEGGNGELRDKKKKKNGSFEERGIIS